MVSLRIFTCIALISLCSCKAKKATELNHNFSIEFIGSRTQGQIIPIREHENCKIIINYGIDNAFDTAIIYKNDSIIHIFNTNGKYILDTVFVPIDLTGKELFRDEFKNEDKSIYYNKSKKYYNYFIGYPALECVYFKDNQLKSILLNDTSHTHPFNFGKFDYIEWWPSGILKNHKLGNTEKVYNEMGVLQKDISNNEYTLYWNNGVIKQNKKDTWVKNNEITYFTDFYSNGIIKQERFFNNAEPCLTWMNYNSKGELKSTEFKAKVELKEVIFSEPPMVFDDIKVKVVVQPGYRGGGSAGLEEFVRKNWSKEVKLSKKDTGLYKVMFVINRDGSVKFEVSSLNTNSAIMAEFQRVIKVTSGHWKPKEESWKPVMTMYECIFKIRKL